MDEIWKKIELCERNYYISNMGKIKSNNKILKTHKSTGGYLYISVWKNNKVKHIKLHRLVAQAFIPNHENKPFVNHIDGNKLNNCVNNLEWVTNKENISHAYKNGLMNKNKRKNIKINQYDLDGNFIKSWYGFNDIEKNFKVSRSTIRFCCLNKIKTSKGYIWRYAD